MVQTLTRRSFLAAGSSALAAAAGLRGLPRATAPAAPSLTAARQAAYGGLAEAVATGPAMRLAPGASAHAADAFAARYAAWPAQRRAHADAVLDRIARDGSVAHAGHDALALAAVTIGPDDGRAPLAI